MKLMARVRFIHEENAEQLIRAFSQEFNPKSSISIQEEEAELEIHFEKWPTEIVDSITHCKVIEFKCAPHLWQDEEGKKEKMVTSEEPKQEEEEEIISEECQQTDTEGATTEPARHEEKAGVTAEESEPAEFEEKTSEEPESAKTVKVTSKAPKQKKRQNPKKSKQSKEKNCEIPELISFAEKSESYETFVKNVATWLDLGPNYQFFIALAENVTLPMKGKLHWKECKEALSLTGEEYSNWRKTSCTVKVAEKFKESENDVTILKLLEAVIGYRTFNFHKEAVQVTQTVETAQENNTMSDIPSFAEILAKVNKKMPIQARIAYVLSSMGTKELDDEEKLFILNIANAAVRTDKMDMEYILSKANIPADHAKHAQMIFSTFLNDFAKEYAQGKLVKVIDFLKVLQKGIMLETEIEHVTE